MSFTKLVKIVGTVSLCLVYLPKAINLFLKKMRSHHSFDTSAENIPYHQKSAAVNISSNEILVFSVTQQQQQQKSIFIKLGRTVHGGWLNSFHRLLRRSFHQSHPNSSSSQCTLVEFTVISGAVLGTEVNSKLKHSAHKSPWKESWAAPSDVQEECWDTAYRKKHCSVGKSTQATLPGLWSRQEWRTASCLCEMACQYRTECNMDQLLFEKETKASARVPMICTIPSGNDEVCRWWGESRDHRALSGLRCTLSRYVFLWVGGPRQGFFL